MSKNVTVTLELQLLSELMAGVIRLAKIPMDQQEAFDKQGEDIVGIVQRIAKVIEEQGLGDTIVHVDTGPPLPTSTPAPSITFAPPPPIKASKPEVPLAETFFGDSATIKVTILYKIGTSNQFKCVFGEGDNAKEVSRHKDRLKPLNDAARALLNS